MLTHHLEHLACPKCKGDLEIQTVEKQNDNRIEQGIIRCVKCNSTYSIVNFIPRFVQMDNYASNFGLEWNKHYRTQYDSYSGFNISEKRFFEETRWNRDLKGEKILEVGSGSGRFTEHAVSTGAFVISIDYSSAVEANYRSNGNKENLLIVQGDIYSMPLRQKYFDRLFCFGVLQHTPDPFKSFMQLPQYVKSGGSIAVDVYKKTFTSMFGGVKYFIRPITREIKPERLYKMVVRYIDFMWPLCSLFRKVPVIGKDINVGIGIADYSHLGLKGELLKEWSYLDTFDMFSPKYDYPQTLSTVKEWFNKAGLIGADVKYGYNGIEGRGKVP